MAGCDNVRFNGVRFNVSYAARRPCNVSRMPRRRTVPRSRNSCARQARSSRQRPDAHRGTPPTPPATPPYEKPHSATAGQPSPNSHPVRARISATACANVFASVNNPANRSTLHGLVRTTLKAVRRNQRRRVESRPIAAAGDQRKSETIIGNRPPPPCSRTITGVPASAPHSGRAGHKRRCSPQSLGRGVGKRKCSGSIKFNLRRLGFRPE